MTDKASTLRALHIPGNPLVLPNVWDAASARLVRDAGFPAVATGSAAVADVLGYADGEGTPVEEMLAAVARIARAVDVPVTADMERGYGLPPAELAERLLETGAVGCNLEDSTHRAMIDPDEQADYLARVREAAGDALVINARVDTYVAGTKELSDAATRARKYREAGADCVYPIVLQDPAQIEALAAEGSVNVLFTPATESIAALAGLGVARISFGAGLHRATQQHTGRLVDAVKDGRNPYQ